MLVFNKGSHRSLCSYAFDLVITMTVSLAYLQLKEETVLLNELANEDSDLEHSSAGWTMNFCFLVVLIPLFLILILKAWQKIHTE